MGEVYRAEDMRLGQAVALKFLPASLAQNPLMLARFHNEVRAARQVTHANVCRVHDIGEADGQPYITMECVDGENLASLLRRIGRLPGVKAVEIARQICAGLAAAHDRGVLHRDLKPENVMLDGEGRVRLMDFGLAAVRDDLSADDLRSGTPAYMAPEQIEGREVTVRSDLYALGLVLQEMFTGRQVFDAPTLADLRRQRESFSPERTRIEFADVDPAVERVIRRCLERDPAERPASALAVAVALPGGDPLRAAIAAGELPSPEMVAAAGAHEGISGARAWIALALAVLGVVGTLGLAHSRSVAGRGPVALPPEALAERARAALRSAGLDTPAADRAYGFRSSREALAWLGDHGPADDRFRPLATQRIGATQFWYRQAPRDLTPDNIEGRVSMDDPSPADESGSGVVSLDEAGRLLSLLVVPPQVPGPAPEGAAVTQWDPLFEAAGLDPKSFETVEPEWIPVVYADSRAAWKGIWPEPPGIPIRIEAASFRGEPVSFEVVRPWSRPARMKPYVPSRWERVGQNLNILLVLVGLSGAGFLARRSLVSGRGDSRGALRLSFAVFVTTLLSWACNAHHQSVAPEEWSLLLQGIAFSLLLSGICCVLYLGLEPIVRKRWPDALIGWSRLLAGRVRDSLVARDVLYGLAAAPALAWIVGGVTRAAQTFTGTATAPAVADFSGTLGMRSFVGQLAGTSVGVLLSPMMILLLLAVLRGILRSNAAALVVTLLLLGPVVGSARAAAGAPWLSLLIGILVIGAMLFVVVRFGLLALMAMTLAGQVMARFPATLDPDHWFFGYAAAAAAVIVAMAIGAFARARARGPAVGRPA